MLDDFEKAKSLFEKENVRLENKAKAAYAKRLEKTRNKSNVVVEVPKEPEEGAAAPGTNRDIVKKFLTEEDEKKFLEKWGTEKEVEALRKKFDFVPAEKKSALETVLDLKPKEVQVPPPPSGGIGIMILLIGIILLSVQTIELPSGNRITRLGLVWKTVTGDAYLAETPPPAKDPTLIDKAMHYLDPLGIQNIAKGLY